MPVGDTVKPLNRDYLLKILVYLKQSVQPLSKDHLPKGVSDASFHAVAWI